MARDRLEGPILIDSLDKPNATTTTTTVKPYSPWPMVVAIICASLFLAGMVAYVIIWLQSSYSIAAAFFLWSFAAVVLLSVAFVFIGLGLFVLMRAFRAGIHSLNDGVPVSMFTIWTQGLSTSRVADKYYDVMAKRAEHSDYQGVQTLTLDKSAHTETSTTTVGADEPDGTEDNVPIAKDKSTLEDLKDKGHIGRSNNSIMIGYSNGNNT